LKTTFVDAPPAGTLHDLHRKSGPRGADAAAAASHEPVPENRRPAIGVAARSYGHRIHLRAQREERIANEARKGPGRRGVLAREQQLKPFRKNLEAIQAITISILTGRAADESQKEK